MSEYSKLLDLAIKNGANQSDIVENIRSKVLDNYHTLYPDSPRNVEVVINAISGDIKIVSDNKDIAPKEFINLAEKSAREIIIEYISKNESTPNLKPEQIRDENDNFTSFITSFLFWGYNILYIALTSLILILTLISSESRIDFLNSITETSPFKVLFVLGLLLIPHVMVFLSVNLKRQNIKYKYGAIFFLLEIPLLVAGSIFLLLFPEPSKIMIFLFLIIISSVPIIFANITGYVYKSKLPLFVFLFIKQCLFLTVSYLCVILSFYIIPFFAEAFNDILFSRSFDFVDMFFGLLQFVIIFIPILIIISIPFVMAYKSLNIYYLQWTKALQDKGEKYLLASFIGITAIWISLVAIFSYQPNPDKYFDKLINVQKLTTYEERESAAKELIDRKKLIENAIDDMANHKARYIKAKNDKTISALYTSSLNLDKDTALAIEDIFDIIAYPFVYQGNRENRFKITTAYNYLFESEETIGITSKNVNLVKRSIDVTTSYDNLLATITIDDEFKNTTSRNEEVSYHFSLPPGSVITSLLLGPNLEFTGLIAPQGAATRTFNAQIRAQRDPALLEQIGPNSFRLRVFPIPGKFDTITLKGKNQRVAYTYVTAVEKSGFSLPSYETKNNIDDSNVNHSLKVNGVNAKLSKEEATKHGFVTSKEICDYTLNSQTDHLNKVSSYSFQNPCNLIPNAKGFNIAIYLNTSAKNEQFNYEEKLLNFFKDNESFLQTNNVEIYKYNDLVGKPQILNNLNKDQILNNIYYFGDNSLNNFPGNVKYSYDFVFVFDDVSNMSKTLYDNVLIINESGYLEATDSVLPTLLKSNTYSFLSFEQALVYALASKSSSNTFATSNISVEFSDAYIDLPIPLETKQSDPLSFVFAQALVYEKIRTRSNATQDISFLDELNLLAKSANIVTPYSSLIALVNDQQISQLERESMRADRYSEQNTTQPRPIIMTESINDFSSGLNTNFFGVDKNASGSQIQSPSGFQELRVVNYSSGIFSIVRLVSIAGMVIVAIGGISYIIRNKLRK